MLLTLDRDEVPVYITEEYTGDDNRHHDMTIEVDDNWWNSYQDVRKAFYDMQAVLAAAYGDPGDWVPEDEDEDDDGPDCD